MTDDRTDPQSEPLAPDDATDDDSLMGLDIVGFECTPPSDAETAFVMGGKSMFDAACTRGDATEDDGLVGLDIVVFLRDVFAGPMTASHRDKLRRMASVALGQDAPDGQYAEALARLTSILDGTHEDPFGREKAEVIPTILRQSFQRDLEGEPSEADKFTELHDRLDDVRELVNSYAPSTKGKRGKHNAVSILAQLCQMARFGWPGNDARVRKRIESAVARHKASLKEAAGASKTAPK